MPGEAMSAKAVQLAMYGAIVALMKEPTYFYKNSIVKYASWSDEGEKELQRLLLLFTPAILAAENEIELDLSRKLMLDELGK